LGRAAIREGVWLAWGAGGLAGELLGVDPIWVLLAAGIAALFRARLPGRGAFLMALAGIPGAAGSASAVITHPLSIGLFFLKVGALLFGSGMVLFAFIERDIVAMDWRTPSQLVDAIAIGQMTPGPVLSSATFIGWLLAGPFGAVAATVGAFLPAFALMSFVAPNVRRLRELEWAREVLAGVSAAVVGNHPGSRGQDRRGARLGRRNRSSLSRGARPPRLGARPDVGDHPARRRDRRPPGPLDCTQRRGWWQGPSTLHRSFTDRSSAPDKIRNDRLGS
jgi:chromate transporter